MSRSGADPAGVGRSTWWGLALRATVLAAALVFLARGVKWHDIAGAVKRAGLLVPSLVIVLNAGMMSLRALRLRVLLQKKLSFASAFTVLLTSSALNNLTPLRGGHVARLWMLERTAGVTKSAALAITLIENLIEIAVLAMLGFAASWLVRGQRWATVTTPVIISTTLVLLFLLRASAARMAKAATTEPRPSAQGGGLVGGWPRARQFFVHLEPGFRALSGPGVCVRVGLLSLGAWTCEATMILLCARSMGLDVSLPLAGIVLVGINLALTLPSTPASAGPFEGATVAVLLFAGLAKGPAVAFALFYHAIQVVPVTVAGVAVLLGGKRRRGRTQAHADAESAQSRSLAGATSEQF